MLFSSGIRFFPGPTGFKIALRPFGEVRNLHLHASVSLSPPDSTAGQCGKGDAAAQDDIEAQARQPAATGTTSADQTGGDQDWPDDGHDQWRTTGSAGGHRSSDGKFS